MLGYINRLLKNRKGFTLIELMVVIVILGILAGVAVQSMGSGATDKANEARAKADIRTIVSALEMYKLDVGAYPITAAGLNALVYNDNNGGTDDPASDNITNWKGSYLKKLPIDPNGTTAGETYEYTISSGVYTVQTEGGTVTSNNL